jgi:ABC-2 type transport system permease protein
MKNNKFFSLNRIISLIKKETYQIFRDPSSILIAFIFPLILLFLFAYGISLDLKNIHIGIVNSSNTPIAERLINSFKGSKYFNVSVSNNRQGLEPLLIGNRLSAIIVIPNDFEKRINSGFKSLLQVLINGADSNSATLLLNYIRGTIQNWLVHEGFHSNFPVKKGLINIKQRVWYNEEIDSRETILPGSIAVIITLIGTMLTSLIVAREWERGTMEALLATSVTRIEILLGKFIPYFLLGMSAMAMVTAISILWFNVPFRGSFWVLGLVSASFMSFSLGLGLFISTVTKNQFIATQAALIVGFLPSFILSGLVFEISSMPLPIRLLTCILPPRYFVSSLRTLFLAGNIWGLIIPNFCIMSFFAILFLGMTLRKTKMDLEV